MPILLVLLFAFTSSASETPKAAWETWKKKEFAEFEMDPANPFTLVEVAELNPGDTVFLELGASTPKWLKAEPKDAKAEFHFDGKTLTLHTGAEKNPYFLTKTWTAPNGLVVRASGVRRGAAWLFLHSPRQNRFKPSLMPYYPFNPRAVVRASIDRTRKDDHPVVKTTQGDTRDYKVIGVANFVLRGKKESLQLFSTDPDKPLEIFIPFKDQTSGKATYGGGRFVEAELESAGAGEITIDFNRAYNPYCAYTHYYNCPLVTGNALDVEVKAGAKIPPKRLD